MRQNPPVRWASAQAGRGWRRKLDYHAAGVLMRHQFGDITSEEWYFHEVDVDLIERMRKRAECEMERRCMAEASQIRDPAVLAQLHDLGYTPATVPLLCMAPVLQVAWANGSVSHAERDRVWAIAAQHGVEEGSAIHRQLEEWMEHSPGEKFFEGSLQVIEAVLETLPEQERQSRQHTLMQDCTEVASAPGWHIARIGGPERGVLHHLLKRLQMHREKTEAGSVGS
jgi:hypothetical protein